MADGSDRVGVHRSHSSAARRAHQESQGRRLACLAEVLGIAGQLSPAPAALVLAAREVQSVRMGNGRGIRKAPAGGPARLGRDFWFYFSGQAVSQLGGSFTTFALPLLVFKLTHSATNLALTTVAEFVPYLLFGLLLGAVVDRFDRKRLMLGSDIAQALVIAVIPVLAIGGVLRIADIYAVTFVQSTLGIIFDCGEFAAIPSLVGEQELVTANARIMAANNAGQILGPGLAGALVAFVPVASLLFVDAGSFLVSSGCLALIRRSFNAAAPARRPAGSAVRALLADVREGLAYVWSNPVLRSISIMMALINLVAATADSQLVLFARACPARYQLRDRLPVCRWCRRHRRRQSHCRADPAACLLRRHRPRRPRHRRFDHDRHGPGRLLRGRTGPVGGVIGFWPVV